MDTREAGVPGWTRSRGWGGIWGDDDEVGALNAITRESVVASLRAVTQGEVYDLGVTIDSSSYLGPAHARTQVLAYRTAEGLRQEMDLAGIEHGSVSFQTSVVTISDHAGTQLDALSHSTFGPTNHWYNGFTAAECSGDFGCRRADAASIPPIVAPAVLVDLPTAMGVEQLEPGYPIRPGDLDGTLGAEGVDVVPGDVVLVRTGVMRHWRETGVDHESIRLADTAGLTLESARWLVEEKGALLIASDNSAVEVLPPRDGENAAPVHKYLLVDQGVHMGELHYLEELARDRVYRSCYVALAPKVRGTTGGFAMRPIAIV